MTSAMSESLRTDNRISRLEDRVADLEGEIRSLHEWVRMADKRADQDGAKLRALERRLDDFIAGRFSPPELTPAEKAGDAALREGWK
jgi:uncharacterized coiled-coil protein SlyX